MTHDRVSVLGLFAEEGEAESAVRDLRESRFRIERVYSPVPSHRLLAARNLSSSPVGWITLSGGITGFITGFLVAAFSATRWNLIVSGKPVLAWIPFVIVGFEFTILFAVIANVIGFLLLAKLPRFRPPARYDFRLSGCRYGVVAACDEEGLAELVRFLEARGAETTIFGTP